MRSLLRRLRVGAEIRGELTVESVSSLVPGELLSLHRGERLGLRHDLCLSLRERLRREIAALRIGESAELSSSGHRIDGVLHLRTSQHQRRFG